MTTPASIFQHATIGETGGDWSRTVSFNQFNASDGTLLDAVFTTSGTVDATASIENLAPVAATVDLGVGATIDAFVPGLGGVASIAPIAIASVNLGAFQGVFDGNLNFSGPSGTVLPDLTASGTQIAIVTPGTAGSLPLQGTGTFGVTVSSYSTSTVHGNGNLAVLLHGSTGADLSLRYDTVPSGNGSSDGSSGSVFIIATGPRIFPGISAVATTTPQVVVLPSQTSGWTASASFDKFDPALGTLDEILLNVGNTLSGTFAAENLETVSAWVSLSETASMTVVTPGDPTGLVANASTIANLSLGAYDGATDLAGTSGQSETIPAGQAYLPFNATPLTSAADLAAFTGTGTIALPVSSAGTSAVSGPSNLLEEVTQQTGGTITVSYVYTPAGPGDAAGGPLPSAASPGFSTTIGASSFNPPMMKFIGSLGGSAYEGARPNETFLIGSGAGAFIAGFSAAAGDRLDLTGLLAGAPLAHDLSNLGSYLSVTGQTVDVGGSWDTTLAVNGPGGAASLVLASGNTISVLDLLGGNALVLPSH